MSGRGERRPLLSRPGVAGLVLVGLGWVLQRAPADAAARMWWPWLMLAGAVLVAGPFVLGSRRRLGGPGWSTRRNVPAWAGLVGVVVAGLGVLMATVMPEATPGRAYWPWLIAVGALITGGAGLAWRNRRGGSAGLVGRWSRRARRNQGVASPWAILRVASALAMRRRATVLRPSLAELSWWRRARVPTLAVATPLARVGMLRVWSPVEDVTLRIGGPRTGKTGELAGRILDAPGAVIATSTRTDLLKLTGPVRSLLGPVGVFNPSGLGGLSSSVTFDPLCGCQEPATATARAADLLGAVTAAGRGGDVEYWASQARRVLACLLHAAALGQVSMREVLGWVANPDTAGQEVQGFLRRSPQPAYESDALQFLTTNDRTRSSICATIMPALGWLTDATAAAAATGTTLNVAELLEQRATVYLLGAEDAQVAPLVAALTGHIAREARRIAATRPGGRLDPPLTLALDEAALICPVPLDNWTADMGGRGVTIHIAAQSRAQLRQRWGPDGAAAIMNNAATLLVYGGTRDPEDLHAYATLTGERDEPVPSFDDAGRVYTTTIRRVPVLSAAQIAQLPAGHVLIVKRGLPPAVGRVQMAWKRPDVQALHQVRRRAARAQRWQQVGERTADWLVDRLTDLHPRFVDFAARVHATNDQQREARDRAHTQRPPWEALP